MRWHFYLSFSAADGRPYFFKPFWRLILTHERHIYARADLGGAGKAPPLENRNTQASIGKRERKKKRKRTCSKERERGLKPKTLDNQFNVFMVIL